MWTHSEVRTSFSVIPLASALGPNLRRETGQEPVHRERLSAPWGDCADVELGEVEKPLQQISKCFD